MTTPPPAATCEPPKGTIYGSHHWLSACRGTVWLPARYCSDWWDIGGRVMSCEEAAIAGYRYASPCLTPQEMAERERLTGVLARFFVDTWSSEVAVFESDIGIKSGLVYDHSDGIQLTGLGRLALTCAQEAT